MAISKTSVSLMAGIGLTAVLGAGYFAADNYARDLITDRLNEALKDTATETGIAVTTAGFFEYNITVPDQIYRNENKGRAVEIKADSALFVVKPESLTDLAKAAMGKGNAYFHGYARTPESFSAVFKTKHPESFYGYETVQMNAQCNSTDLTLVLGKDQYFSTETNGCTAHISATGKSVPDTTAMLQFDFGTGDTPLKEGSQSNSVRFSLSHMNMNGRHDVTFDGSLRTEIYSWGGDDGIKNMAYNFLGEGISISIGNAFNGTAIALNANLLDAYVSLSNVDTYKGEFFMRSTYQSAGEGRDMVMAACTVDAGNIPFANQRAMTEALGGDAAVEITPDHDALITGLNKTLAEAVIDAFYNCSISTQNGAKRLNVSGKHEIKQDMAPAGGGSLKVKGVSIAEAQAMRMALKGTSAGGIAEALIFAKPLQNEEGVVLEYEIDESGTLSINDTPIMNLLTYR